MNTPAWSRLKFTFDEKIRMAFLTVTVLGTVIRIENVIPYEWSFLTAGNIFISIITLNSWTASSIELTYLSSILYLVALAIFSLALPRDIQVTTSRDDYVERSLRALNALNVGDWLRYYLHQHHLRGPIAPTEVIKRLTQYESYCSATAGSGSTVDFDNTFKSNIVLALQYRYDHFNRESGKNLRRAAFVCIFTSAATGMLVIVDSVFQTLTEIF